MSQPAPFHFAMREAAAKTLKRPILGEAGARKGQMRYYSKYAVKDGPHAGAVLGFGVRDIPTVAPHGASKDFASGAFIQHRDADLHLDGKGNTYRLQGGQYVAIANTHPDAVNVRKLLTLIRPVVIAHHDEAQARQYISEYRTPAVHTEEE